MFKEEDKSSFPYWFAHWCAYNMTALVHNGWKFKYLFHDAEKPYMRLFMPYVKVRVKHRKMNRHHPEWLNYRLGKYETPTPKQVKRLLKRFDFEAAIVDWECSRFTKPKVLTARQEFERLTDETNNNPFFQRYPFIFLYCKEEFKEGLINAMKKLGLYE